MSAGLVVDLAGPHPFVGEVLASEQWFEVLVKAFVRGIGPHVFDLVPGLAIAKLGLAG